MTGGGTQAAGGRLQSGAFRFACSLQPASCLLFLTVTYRWPGKIVPAWRFVTCWPSIKLSALCGGITRATCLRMKRKRFSNLALACQLLAAAGGFTVAAQDSGQVTADSQKSNKADRDLTQKIRKSVVSDKSLSISAHNVKIISRDGMVTLRGTVKSDDEKKSIEDKATEIAGQGKVTSELTVTGSGSK